MRINRKSTAPASGWHRTVIIPAIPDSEICATKAILSEEVPSQYYIWIVRYARILHVGGSYKRATDGGYMCGSTCWLPAAASQSRVVRCLNDEIMRLRNRAQSVVSYNNLPDTCCCLSPVMAPATESYLPWMRSEAPST